MAACVEVDDNRLNTEVHQVQQSVLKVDEVEHCDGMDQKLRDFTKEIDIDMERNISEFESFHETLRKTHDEINNDRMFNQL